MLKFENTLFLVCLAVLGFHCSSDLTSCSAQVLQGTQSQLPPTHV